MLADATRVQLLWALIGGELKVNDLADRVGKPAPSVSQHLAKLRMARLVRTRREGTQVFYRLENDHVRQLVMDAVHNAEHAAGGVPAHHLGDREVRVLHEGIGTDGARTQPRPPSPRSGPRGQQRGHPRGQDQPGVLGLTAAIQLVIVVVSGSVALFADTVHNLSDALTAVPLWIAFALSRRAASRRYTYGLGRVEDLAGLFVVAMIALSAVVAAVEAIRRLIDPVPLSHLGWVAAAGVVGFVGNEVVARLPHAGGQTDRVGGAAGRRPARPRRRVDVAGGGGRGGRGGPGLSGRRPDHRPAHRGRHRGGDGRRGPRRVRPTAGPCRPRTRRHRPRRARQAAGGARGAPGADAVGRAPAGSRRRAGRRTTSCRLAAAHGLAHDAEHQLAHAIPKLDHAVVHAYPAHHHDLVSS